jgi:hypothetical protein
VRLDVEDVAGMNAVDRLVDEAFKVLHGEAQLIDLRLEPVECGIQCAGLLQVLEGIFGVYKLQEPMDEVGCVALNLLAGDRVFADDDGKQCVARDLPGYVLERFAGVRHEVADAEATALLFRITLNLHWRWRGCDADGAQRGAGSLLHDVRKFVGQQPLAFGEFGA